MRVDLSPLSACARTGIHAVVLFYDSFSAPRSRQRVLLRRGLDPDSVRALADRLEKGEELELNEPQQVALCRLLQILLRAMEEDEPESMKDDWADAKRELSAFLLRVAGFNSLSA